MKQSYRMPRVFSVFAVVVGVMFFGMSAGWAQQKQSIKFAAPAANTKYTQQYAITVGDVGGHEVRIFETVRTFPKNPLIIGEVNVKEWWTRGYADYTEVSGPGTAYHTLMMENGDKIYIRTNYVAQGAVSKDGSKKGANNLVSGPITGGTGKFLGIRGLMKFSATFDHESGSNESKGEFEYWMEK